MYLPRGLCRWGAPALCITLLGCSSTPLAELGGPQEPAKPRPFRGSAPLCPDVATDDWQQLTAAPPSSLQRDPVFNDVVYGFSVNGVVRAEAGSPFCIGSPATPGLSPSVRRVLAPTLRPELRFIDSSVPWAGIAVSRDAGLTFQVLPVTVGRDSSLWLFDLNIEPKTDTLYALAFGLGLIVSDDYAETWRLLEPDPEPAAFSHLFIAPDSPDLYATVADAILEPEVSRVGIWHSTDRGASWVVQTTAIAADANPHLSIAWTRPPTFYASGFDAIQRSKDGGATFETLAEQGKLLLHPTAPNVLYRLGMPDGAGTPATSASVSLDGGDSFIELELPADTRRTPDGEPPLAFRGISATLVDPEQPATLTVMTGLGFFDLSEGEGPVHRRELGVAFSLSTPLHTLGGGSGDAAPYLWVDPRDADHLLVVANGALLESHDAGHRFDVHPGAKDFELVPGSVAAASNHSQDVFAVDAADPSVVYIWGRTTLWLSEDSGKNFARLALDDKRVSGVDPLSASTLYSLRNPTPDSQGCASLRSLDRGRSWACLGNVDQSTLAAKVRPDLLGIATPDSLPLTQLATHPDDSDVLYGLDGEWGFFRSQDGGATWNAGEGLPPALPGQTTQFGMLVSPSEADRLFVGAQYADPFSEWLFASDDQGRTWRKVAEHGLRPTLVDPRSSEFLYAMGPQISTDGGRTFTPGPPLGSKDLGLTIRLAPSAPTVAYGISQAGLFRLANTGLTWAADD